MTRKLRLPAVTLGVMMAAVLMLPRPASAVTALVYDDTLKDIQQTANRPCVIGSPSCTQALPYTTVCIDCRQKQETRRDVDEDEGENWQTVFEYEGANSDRDLTLRDINIEVE